MIARLGMVACLAAAALIVPGVASASKMSSSPSNSGSAIDQYNEKCQTPTGWKPCKIVKKSNFKQSKLKLSKKASKALASTNASTRNELKSVAANSGQPKEKAAVGMVTISTIPKNHARSSFGSSLTASLVSSGAGSAARLAVLLAAVIGISVVTGVVAVRKQRV